LITKKSTAFHNSGTTGQLDHASAPDAKKKFVEGDDVSVFKPAQISPTGREPLPQRPATQCGLRHPE
jgi:hypothetical protein